MRFVTFCVAALFLAQSAQAKPFSHPGVLHNQAELTFIKEKISAGEEPWASAWKNLQNSDLASLNHKPQPREKVIRGPYNNPDIGSSEFSSDGAAVYAHALQWCLSGKKEHAAKAIEILNGWSSTLKTVGGHDTKLIIGMAGVKFCTAAELIRHSDAGWKKEDQAKFEKLLREVFYPPIKDFFPAANGNWDASMIQTMLAMGVFLDDKAMFDRAAEYFRNGKGNGSIENYVNSFGQCQESGRDQAHTQMGLGFLGCAAEIAWKQGVDLYSAADNRLAKGLEYTAKYNLGNDVPFERFRSIDGKYDHKRISDNSRGRFSPIYHRIVYHYQFRKGIAMPYSEEASGKKRRGRKRRSSAHVNWGDLMFAKPPGKSE